ncbi:hypothetical protein PVAND_012237 [Polypedilum vanderplanki]|uniref:Uncharacterized protein n=1 Tax=Polypedilum vanderplanki TaxID=319348 RepID=A0A9J6CM46_POLVA|nr:hypothetical protein PVAND_012237 [Polypedilum vanderplanki]
MKKYNCNSKDCKNYGNAIDNCISILQNEELNLIDKAMKTIESATKEIKKAKENLDNAKNNHEKITNHCKLLEESYEADIKKMRTAIEEKDKQLVERTIDETVIVSIRKDLKKEMGESLRKMLDEKENALKEEYKKKEKQRENEQQILREHYELKRKQLEDEFRNKQKKLRKRKASIESSSTEKSRRLNDWCNSSKSSSSMSPLLPQESMTSAISPIVDKLTIDSSKSPVNPKRTSSPTTTKSLFELIRKNVKPVVEETETHSSTPKSRPKSNEKKSRMRSGDSFQLSSSSRSPSMSPSVNALEQAYFDIDLKTPDQEQMTDDEKTPKTEIVIKSEKKSPVDRRFSQDMFSSDVIYVGRVDDKDKIYSVQASPTLEERQKMLLEKMKNEKETTPFIPSSLSEDESKPSTPIASYLTENRLKFDDECQYCNLFYDEIAEKKSVWHANAALNNCNCKGHYNRKKYLKELENEMNMSPETSSKTNNITDNNEEIKENEIDQPKKIDETKKSVTKKQNVAKKNDHIIRTKLDLIRKKKDRGLEPDERDPNCTPSGFWNLTISPRKNSPIRPKLYKNFTKEQLKELQNFL